MWVSRLARPEAVVDGDVDGTGRTRTGPSDRRGAVETHVIDEALVLRLRRHAGDCQGDLAATELSTVG